MNKKKILTPPLEKNENRVEEIEKKGAKSTKKSPLKNKSTKTSFNDDFPVEKPTKKKSSKKIDEETDSKQVLKVIDDNFQTPILPVKYSSVKTPYFFNNGGGVPRYSITLILDNKKDKKFISSLEALQKQHGAEPFITPVQSLTNKGYLFKSGKSLIKFQTKNKIPVYDLDGHELELTQEIPERTKVSVVFEARCYLNKRTNSNAFNLSPSRIIVHVSAEDNADSE